MRLPGISGEELIKTLNKFGFESVRQKGSHVVMRRGFRVFSVPLHKTVKKGTLLAILKQANISKDDFLKQIK